MSIFKCKMCGGDLELTPGSSVAICQYCGTQQTAPNADNEKKANLYNRANRLRFSNDFDKAASVFESIVAEFPDEAEAYWGLCLCKYGIEYVDDWATGRKIPTCHRTSFDSIFIDNNFRMAMEYAYPEAQGLYHAEAKEIDSLQRAIIDVAKNEPPYDVFICYKETDNNKQRTKDSVQAQDIYDALTDAGYRVFFARISLEDKLGEEYEPYIFSALMSAKVMLVVGTSFENMNAVWVKNEWGRYLQIMRKERGRVLIPCYSDMDAYDMPQEFRNLQAQDMNKVGFIQDLVRGIGKIIVKEQTQQRSVSNESNRDKVYVANRERYKRKAEEKRKKVRRNRIIVVTVAIAVLVGIVITLLVVKLNTQYNTNEDPKVDVDIKNDDPDMVEESNDDMSEVRSLMDKGQYKQATILMETIGKAWTEEYSESCCQVAQECTSNGKYIEAVDWIGKCNNNYSKIEYAEKIKENAMYEYISNTDRKSTNYNVDSWRLFYNSLKMYSKVDVSKFDESLCYNPELKFYEYINNGNGHGSIIKGTIDGSKPVQVETADYFMKQPEHYYIIMYPNGKTERLSYPIVCWDRGFGGFGGFGQLRIDLEYKGEIIASESIQVTN